MLEWIVNRLLARRERQLGVSLEYIRHIYRISPAGFAALRQAMPLTQFRQTLPLDAYSVGRLVAARHEDCGSCVQIEVNLARQGGVSPDILRAVLNDRPEELPTSLAQVYHFARCVVATDGTEEPYREAIRQRYGEQGLVELALGIASCRIFPTTKRALGYATSCAQVAVEI